MPKYEFCECYCDVRKFKNHARHCTYTPNGLVTTTVSQDRARGDASLGDAWRRKLAELGLDGWQLVTIVAYAETVVAYLQRPIP